jgi:tetratricopeptide (TPR) repeat protein
MVSTARGAREILCGVIWLVAVGLTGSAGAAASDAVALNDAAVRLTARGQYEAAAETFEQALRLTPGDPVIRRNFARLRTVQGHRWLAGGQTEQARRAYAAAIQLAPEESAAFVGLGDVHLRLREPRAAVEQYRQAIALAPLDAVGYARLGEAYFQQGDTPGALAAWEQALRCDPADTRIQERIASATREARVAERYRARESQHFRVVYQGGAREEIGRELLAILEQAYADVGYALGSYPPSEIETIFYADRDFADATGVSAGIGGYYHPIDGKIRVAVRGLDPRDPRLRGLIYHEYTHALIFAVTRGNNPPRWVHEGLAVHFERQRADAFRREARAQARGGAIPSLDASPYVMGFAAVEYALDRHGMTGVQTLLRGLGDGMDFRSAFQAAYGISPEAFEAGLREFLVRGY